MSGRLLSCLPLFSLMRPAPRPGRTGESSSDEVWLESCASFPRTLLFCSLTNLQGWFYLFVFNRQKPSRRLSQVPLSVRSWGGWEEGHINPGGIASPSPSCAHTREMDGVCPVSPPPRPDFVMQKKKIWSWGGGGGVGAGGSFPHRFIT